MINYQCHRNNYKDNAGCNAITSWALGLLSVGLVPLAINTSPAIIDAAATGSTLGAVVATKRNRKNDRIANEMENHARGIERALSGFDT